MPELPSSEGHQSRSSRNHHHNHHRHHHYHGDEKHRRRREEYSSGSLGSRRTENTALRARSRSQSPHNSSTKHARHLSRSPGRRQRRDRERHRHPHKSPSSPTRSSGVSNCRSRHRSISPEEPRRSRKPLPSQLDAFTKTPQGITETETFGPEKEKPNYGNTGKLAAETNTVTAKDGSTVILKYHEPAEARKPPAKDDWRLFIFKGSDLLDTIQLSGQTCWLIGKEMSVVDLPVQHPSCSKQHAAIQFRYVEKRNEYGDRLGRVKPYLIDLESSNGTTVNGELAPPGRYMELRDKDVIMLGNSSREYVLMLSPS